jgi:hypothetical protein
MALEGIGDAVTATLFSGDGSKMVAATPLKGPQLLPERAEVIDLNGGPWAIQTVPPILVRIKLK